MPCPRTARSRPMRHLPLAALATAVLGLSACTWVHMAPGAKAVQVMATAPTGCEKRGEVSVSVADKVALVYERNDLRVREELETLARNEDPGIGADTKIGRAHVCTPVTNAPLVCRPLLEKKKTSLDLTYT